MLGLGNGTTVTGPSVAIREHLIADDLRPAMGLSRWRLNGCPCRLNRRLLQQGVAQLPECRKLRIDGSARRFGWPVKNKLLTTSLRWTRDQGRDGCGGSAGPADLDASKVRARVISEGRMVIYQTNGRVARELLRGVHVDHRALRVGVVGDVDTLTHTQMSRLQRAPRRARSISSSMAPYFFVNSSLTSSSDALAARIAPNY